MGENHLLSSGKLLDNKGNLYEAGYALSLVKEYNYKDIKASKLRIKEWDYYYIGNGQYGVALTMSSIAYIGLMSVSFLDFVNKKYITKSEMSVFPFNKYNFPSTSSSGETHFKNDKLTIDFKVLDGKRYLNAEYKNFQNNDTFKCEIELYNEPKDSLVIATPFNKRGRFYYNQKINCMSSKGYFSIGENKYSVENSLATLDWGRGVWTYKNTWYWSSFNTKIGEDTIGFNFGYGFGDTSKASENIIFLNGVGYKVDRLTFDIPNENGQDFFLMNWKIKSNDGLVDLKFVPILDRFDDTNVVIIRSNQHQVFGQFYGKLVCNDRTIELTGQVGFAEKVYNKW